MQKAVDLYDGEIRQTDDNIAALLSALDRKGITKNAIIVVTADHGEEFAEHGRMGHGKTLYEELLRVPLVISAPHVVPGHHQGRANLVDIVPTILDLIGIRSQPVDGLSLRPSLMRGDPIAARDFLAHLDFQDSPTTLKGVTTSYGALAYMHGTEKLLLSKLPFHKELFDLGADRTEHHSVYGQDAQRTASIAAMLSEHYNGLSRRRGRHQTVDVKDETRQSILALGYFAGGKSREEQSIPGSIRPADLDPEGDLGWARLNACIDASESSDESQLLSGWYGAESNGRWTMRDAAVLLPLANAEAHTLTIAGANGRPDAFDLIVANRDQILSTTRVAPGAFSLDVKVPAGLKSNVLRLTTSSTFRPSEHGSRDARDLGVKVARICMR